MCTCIYIHTYIYAYTNVCLYKYTYRCTCVHAYIYIDAHAHVCLDIYIYRHTYIYTCVHTHIYTSSSNHPGSRGGEGNLLLTGSVKTICYKMGGIRWMYTYLFMFLKIDWRQVKITCVNKSYLCREREQGGGARDGGQTSPNMSCYVVLALNS